MQRADSSTQGAPHTMTPASPAECGWRRSHPAPQSPYGSVRERRHAAGPRSPRTSRVTPGPWGAPAAPALPFPGQGWLRGSAAAPAGIGSPEVRPPPRPAPPPARRPPPGSAALGGAPRTPCKLTLRECDPARGGAPCFASGSSNSHFFLSAFQCSGKKEIKKILAP